jgi:hypothetical protein
MITTSCIPSLLKDRKSPQRLKKNMGGPSDWIRLGGIEPEEKPKKRRKKPIYNKDSIRYKKRS